MENTKDIYKQLTSVNLDEQIDKWDERGKGYYGEYRILENILYSLKGDFKVLMNVELPINNKSTEIDMLIIHEVGIFVIEIKYYKGTIYGSSEDVNWTQYFRTVRNNIFLNPIKQNDYHIQALKQRLTNVSTYSIVVFTNSECNVKIKNNRDDVIVTNLNGISQSINSVIQNKNKIFSIEEIDSIFNKLKQYSKISETVDNYIDNKNLEFNDLIKNLVKDYNKRIEETEKSLTQQKNKYIKVFLFGLIGLVVTLLISFSLIKGGFIIKEQKALASRDEAIVQLEEMQQKFKRIDDYSNIPIQINKDAFKILNFSLNKNNTIKDAFRLQFGIKNNSNYLIQLLENTEIVVHLKNGDVKSYPMFGERIKYNKYSQKIAKGSQGNFSPIDLLSIDDKIIYIKMINIKLINNEGYKEISVIDNLEIELYKQEK